MSELKTPSFFLSLSLSQISMPSHSHRLMDSEDPESALFHSYPCAYFVQSPSTISHANSADHIPHNAADFSGAFHSPLRSETFIAPENQCPEAASRLFALSRYSSSRGSNNSFSHHKKIISFDGSKEINGGGKRLIIIDHGGGVGGDDGDDEDEEEMEEEEYYGRKGGWWRRYCSFRKSSSCAWICLQLCWRFMLSLGVALLVFYIATKPPPPNISIKIGGIRQFELGEGVDTSGVTTNILTCNCSMELVIENKSKLFDLHIHPPILDISFGRLPFAISHGRKLNAERHTSTLFELYVGTKNKPMYGAGRSMQDMLESGKGLPLLIRVRLSSNFRVVWNLIHPKFHHQAQCLVLLQNAYDKKHRTQAYNSSCVIMS